jgi:glucokinase
MANKTRANLVVGDIGGTNSRFAVVQSDGEPGPAETYANDAAGGVEELVRRFLSARDLRHQDTRVRLAVACPVAGDLIRFTNRDWSFSISELRETLMLSSLGVMNDFSAIALALPHLGDEHLVDIGGGRLRADAPKVVLGPGTGLGVAASIPVAGTWYPIAGEGGHVTLASLCDEDARIMKYVRARYGHVSGERLLTGPGLRLLYEAQSGQGAKPKTAPSPEEITRLAASRTDDIATKVMEQFFALLGGLAGNLALSFGACGGIYLAGGILPQVRDLLLRSGFREGFEAKGRFRIYLADIATQLIIHPQPALLGLSQPLPDGVAIEAE